jgi:hypothetical protein
MSRVKVRGVVTEAADARDESGVADNLAIKFGHESAH